MNIISTTTLVFQVLLKDTSSHISISSKWLYLSPKYLLNFFSNQYSITAGGNFQIYVQIMGLRIKKKIDSKHFYS